MTTHFNNPLTHSVTFAGYILVDPADGTWVSVEQGADVATHTVGAYGNVTFSYSADRTTRVTVRLKPHSPSNVQLQRMADTFVRGPFEVRTADNPLAQVLVRAPFATIQSRPSMGRGSELTMNEWVFILDNTQQEV